MTVLSPEMRNYFLDLEVEEEDLERICDGCNSPVCHGHACNSSHCSCPAMSCKLLRRHGVTIRPSGHPDD